jgi:polyhydroxyalkanoate synthase
MRDQAPSGSSPKPCRALRRARRSLVEGDRQRAPPRRRRRRAAARSARAQPFDPTAPAAPSASSPPISGPTRRASEGAAEGRFRLDEAVAVRRLARRRRRPSPSIAPERGDRRFNDPAWSEEPVFDYLKQAYLLTAKRALEMVEQAEGWTRAPAPAVEFFTQQYLNAISPANFAFTNPEAIRRAIDTGSISLLSGLANLLADAARRAGSSSAARARSSSSESTSPRLRAASSTRTLMQLIQYAPTTDEVYKRPLLYVPPLVNKYYLLDLQPKSSLIRWLVEQGHSVFVISWVNPGPELADKGYRRLHRGPVEALDAIEQATGEREVDLFGFCMGGTLVAMRSPGWRRRGRASGSPPRPRSDRCSISADSASGRPSPSPSSCGDGAAPAPQGLHGRAGAAGAVQRGARQRPDLVVGGQPLPARPRGAAVRHPLLVRRRRPYPARLPAELGASDVLRDNKLKEPGGIVLDGVPIDLGAIETPLLASRSRTIMSRPGRRPTTAPDCSAAGLLPARRLRPQCRRDQPAPPTSTAIGSMRRCRRAPRPGSRRRAGRQLVAALAGATAAESVDF